MAKPPQQPADAVPKDGVRWPLFLIAAALMIQTDQGDLGCRCLQSYRIAPNAKAAQVWFMEQVQRELKSFMVMDLTVLEVPVITLQMALGIASMKQEHPV